MNEKEIIEFAKLVGKLKTTVRTGWEINGVKNPESVAEHSYRTAVLAMLIADLKGLNAEKLMRMALLHDLEEAITGDIMTLEKERRGKEKFVNAGKKALKQSFSKLPKKIQKRYLDMWLETKKEKTKYSKLLRQIDYIELMIQCSEYQKKQPNVKKNLNSFWKNVDNAGVLNRDKYFERVYKQLKKMRK